MLRTLQRMKIKTPYNKLLCVCICTHTYHVNHDSQPSLTYYQSTSLVKARYQSKAYYQDLRNVNKSIPCSHADANQWLWSGLVHSNGREGDQTNGLSYCRMIEHVLTSNTLLHDKLGTFLPIGLSQWEPLRGYLNDTIFLHYLTFYHVVISHKAHTKYAIHIPCAFHSCSNSRIHHLWLSM